MRAPKICATIYLFYNSHSVSSNLRERERIPNAKKNLPNCFHFWEPFENNKGYCNTRTEVCSRGREADIKGKDNAACIS